jgi:acetyltransferase-like isoleucine patch superfamily enzyme
LVIISNHRIDRFYKMLKRGRVRAILRLRYVVRSWLRQVLRQLLAGAPEIYGDPRRVMIHPDAKVLGCTLNVSSGTITIGPWVFFGHGVSIITGTHDIALRGKARVRDTPLSGRDIVIEEGAWIASNATVLGPCRIGAHAVVAAGAVVRHDVRPEEIVGGVPAKHLGWVPRAE